MSVYKLLIKEIGTVEPGIVLIYAGNESAFQSISTVNIVLAFSFNVSLPRLNVLVKTSNSAFIIIFQYTSNFHNPFIKLQTRNLYSGRVFEPIGAFVQSMFNICIIYCYFRCKGTKKIQYIQTFREIFAIFYTSLTISLILY